VLSAMEWLLQHENDPDIDLPLPEQEEAEQVRFSSSIIVL